MEAIRISLITILSISFSILNGSEGSLSGKVQDINTHQPLVGVNVIVIGTDLGAATDSLGNFIINDIPVGSYDINTSMIGYRPINRPNVHIVPKRKSITNFDLYPMVIESDNIIVTGNYFEKTKDAVTSNRTIDIVEIRSDPVGIYDVMAMMQALPSVISGNDQSNEIIVRGGMHNENLFVMDYLEIPFPNHFPEQGSGGGPVTMLETDFIERIDFYAGAFPARYGEKLSSVMDVKLREGNREKNLGQFSMTMAGFGGNVEGPIMGNGSYLISLQRSFLDFVISGTGLQAIPEYWTSQGKLSYDLSPTKKIMFNYLGGVDAISLENEDGPLLRGAENVDYGSKQITAGLTYKNLFSKKGFGVISFSTSVLTLDIDVYEIEVYDDQDYYKNEYARNDDIEIENTIRGEINYSISNSLNLNTGFSTKLLKLDYDRWFKVRPNYVYGYSFPGEIPSIISRDEFYERYYGNDSTIVTQLDTIGFPDTNKTNNLRDLWKTGGFIHLTYRPIEKLDILLGGRYDHLDYTEKGSFSSTSRFLI
ncbi:MAG: TonB-dependent receptor [Candidatus Neomarinimicrobiota bacterium]